MYFYRVAGYLATDHKPSFGAVFSCTEGAADMDDVYVIMYIDNEAKTLVFGGVREIVRDEDCVEIKFDEGPDILLNWGSVIAIGGEEIREML